MSFIPQDRLLPQDLVNIYDHGPADAPHDPPHDPPVLMRMHASDARHAMDVEPQRYRLDEAPAALPAPPAADADDFEDDA